MSSGIGGHKPPATTATILGPPVLDASKFGAVPGNQAATLNAALANAKTYAGAVGITKAAFYVPATSSSSPFYFADSLWMPDGWDFVGAGVDKSFVQNASNYDSSCVVVGQQANLGTPLTNHWQSLAGIADSGWASGRLGFRTATAGGSPANNDYAQIMLQPNALAYGPNFDGWASTQGFTVELLAQGYTIVDGAPIPGLLPPGATFGLATDKGNASPWYVMFEGGAVTNIDAASGAAITVECPDVHTGYIPAGAGYLTFTTGTLAGQTYAVASATQPDPTGHPNQYALTLATPLSGTPGATDGAVYYVGVSLHYTAATGLLNNVPGQYDPTYGGTESKVWWRLPVVATTAIVQPQRWIFQLDLTGSPTANLAQAAVSCGSPALASMQWLARGDSLTAPANPYFQENGYVPFVVAGLGPKQGFEAAVSYPKTYNAASYAGGMDWLVGGLSVVAKAAGGNVYSVGTTGAAPVLNPSGPRPTGTVNDTFRYDVAGVAGLVGWLTLDSSPADAFGGCYARAGGPLGIAGGWVRQDVSANPSFGHAATVRDVTITSNGKSGNAVEIGYCINQTIRDVHLLGFANAVGNNPTASNYPHRIINVVADFPSQASLYGYLTTFWCDKLIATNGKRAIVRMAGSDLTLRSAYLGAVTGSVAFKQHGVDYAGAWIVEEISWDSEGAGNPPVALFDYEANGSSYDQLTIRNSALGYIGTNAAFVRMRGTAAKPVVVAIRDNTWAYWANGAIKGPFAFATVDSDAAFVGRIENCPPTTGWDFAQPTLPVKSFAASGKSAVIPTLDLPGVTLPPALSGTAAGTRATNFRDATANAIVECVYGSDNLWHATATAV